MNGNIEVVNENLWCVNQHYVHAGYIKELTLLPGTSLDKEIYLTNQGILVLNTAAPAYEITRKMLLRVMGHTDEQLEYAQQKMQKVEKPDAYVKMYLNVLEWEIERRCVKAEYIASQPKPTFLDKFKSKAKKFLERR